MKADGNDFKNYERRPIQLSEHAIAIIKLYSRTDYFEDCFEIDIKGKTRMHEKEYEDSARQFVYQLEGQWNGCFMKALIKELKKYYKEYGFRHKKGKE
jgi:hypothetical protein